MALALGTGAWMYTTCPRCHKQPGEHCTTPKGRKTRMSHGDRVQAYIREVPDAMANATVRACSFEDFVQELKEKCHV